MRKNSKLDAAYWNRNLYVWMITRFTGHKVSTHAGHVTFFLLLSFFPTIMLILKIMSQLPGIDPTSIVHDLESVMPGNMRDMFSSSLRDILTPSGTIYIFTILSMLWAGSKGFDGLAMALDNIYASKDKRGYIKRRAFSILYLLGFVFVFIVSVLLIVFGGYVLSYITQSLHFPFEGFVMRIILRYGLIITILTTFFLLLLRFCPYTPGESKEARIARHKSNKNKPFRERTKSPKHRTIRKEIPGAILTTILWLIFTIGFSFYVGYRLANPSYYGSLASVFLALLWLYFCVMFIFIGALFNNYAYRHGESSTKHLIKDLPGLFLYIKLKIQHKL